MKRLVFLVITLMLLAAGCTTIHQSARGTVPLEAEWVVLPFVNNTETPYAAERAEAITTALLYARGVQQVKLVPAEVLQEDSLLPSRGEKNLQTALQWAQNRGIAYAVSGTVTEWRYKVGLDGEPVAGVTLQVLALPGGEVVWSGSASKSGWSRASVSAVGQQILEKLISSIEVR
ncbi:MAG: hypothetical protein SCI25_04805 [Desulfuromonadales bacterium]|nr:hypothetical protein [Desulfuromonadales bacterium]MDW7758596.1 hypothetical protein [Desulfuromonadales bacterium]